MKMQHNLIRLIALTMLIGALLLASCSRTPTSPATSGTPVGTAKPYGSLIVAVDYTSGSLDPQVTSPDNLRGQALGIFDSLVELTPEGKARPGIAERWDIAPDGMSHTFYIRKGIKFHDGSDLTGADVKFSLERILAPEAIHTDAPAWRSLIASVELKDGYTVAIRLKAPLFELLNGFEDFSGGAAVMPKKYIEEKGVDHFRKNPIGSGPFKVVSYEFGSRLELEALESHWRAVPKFKKITLLVVKEEATKVAMLITGELDIAPVSADSVARLKKAGLSILSHYGAAQYQARLLYDLDHPDKYQLGDVRVRKALSLAINRKQMADNLLGGYAEPSAFFYAPKTATFFDSNVLKPDPYDPEGAKKLLAEAGYPNGFSMKLYDTGAGSIHSMLNVAVGGYWQNIGVRVELTPIDSAALGGNNPQTWNNARTTVSGGGIFGFERVGQIYHSKRSSVKNIRNPRLDELIEKVPLTRDPAEKNRLALEAVVMARDEYANTPILDLTTVIALGSKVGELTPIKGMAGLAASLETITHAK